MAAFAPVEHAQTAFNAHLHLRTVQNSVAGEKVTSQQQSKLRFARLTNDREVHGANRDEQPQHLTRGNCAKVRPARNRDLWNMILFSVVIVGMGAESSATESGCLDVVSDLAIIVTAEKMVCCAREANRPTEPPSKRDMQHGHICATAPTPIHQPINEHVQRININAVLRICEFVRGR